MHLILEMKPCNREFRFKGCFTENLVPSNQVLCGQLELLLAVSEAQISANFVFRATRR